MMTKFISFCLFVGIVIRLVSSSLLAIDIGSDSMKVALFRPQDKPIFQIVLNDQSKRKTPTSIAFHEDHRFIGDDANNLVTKQPDKVYRMPFHLLGLTYSSVQLLIKSEEILPTGLRSVELVQSEQRDIVGIFNKEYNITFHYEELVSMLLIHAKRMTQSLVPTETLRDVILTVPPYFTEVQRELVKQAAELAGLFLVDCVNDHLAVAMALGIERSGQEEAEEEQNVLFVDIGASSTRVSLVHFAKPEIKQLVSGEVLAVAWDHQLSGNEIDRQLVNHFLGMIKSDQSKKRKIFKSTIRS